MSRQPSPSQHPKPAGRGLGSWPDWVERLVRALDDGWRIPGTRIRFGLDSVLGLIFPGVGDALTGGGSLAIVGVALRRGVPRVVLVRMLLNLLLDTLVGLLPVVGDVFDLFFKSNRRNLRLLERASTSARPARALDYVILFGAALVLMSLIALPWILAFWLLSNGDGPRG